MEITIQSPTCMYNCPCPGWTRQQLSLVHVCCTIMPRYWCWGWRTCAPCMTRNPRGNVGKANHGEGIEEDIFKAYSTTAYNFSIVVLSCTPGHGNPIYAVVVTLLWTTFRLNAGLAWFKQSQTLTGMVADNTKKGIPDSLPWGGYIPSVPGGVWPGIAIVFNICYYFFIIYI